MVLTEKQIWVETSKKRKGYWLTCMTGTVEKGETESETEPETDLHKFELSFIDKLIKSLTTTSFGNLLLGRILKAFKDVYANTQIEHGYTRGKPDPLALEDLRTRELILSDKTVAGLNGNLRFELLEGLKNKESIDTIKRRLDKIFTGVNTERIARTEILQSMAEGRHVAHVNSGVAKFKVWKSGRDKRVAEDSKRLNGQIQPIDEPFVDPLTKEICMHPPNRPMCRCTALYLRKLPEGVVMKKGLMYMGGDVSKVEVPESVQKVLSSKRIKVKATPKKKEHWRTVKVGIGEETKPEAKPEAKSKPFKDWKAGMPHPAGFKDNAVVEIDGKKLKILEGYISVPDFKCDDGKWYSIVNIDKIHSKDATNTMPDLTEYEGKKSKVKEEKVAQAKRMQTKESDPSKEKFENDVNEFFNECRSNERDANNLSALKEYSGKNYDEVNKYLITGKSTNDRDKLDTQVRSISEILSKAPKYEGEVFRGLKFDDGDKFDEFISHCEKGQHLEMKNFASSSLNKGVASKFATGFSHSVLFTIKSKNGVFLGDVSQNEDEREVLFNHESEFKITNVKEISGSKFEIVMEEI